MLRYSRGFGPIKTHILTAAQLNLLFEVPINLTSLASTLDADAFIQVLMCKLVYIPGTTPFLIGNATNFCLKYADANGPAATGVVAAAGLVDQTVAKAALLVPVSNLVVPAADIFLCLAGANLTDENGNPSDGDGVLGVSLLYRDPVMRVLEDDF